MATNTFTICLPAKPAQRCEFTPEFTPTMKYIVPFKDACQPGAAIAELAWRSTTSAPSPCDSTEFLEATHVAVLRELGIKRLLSLI